MIPDDLKIYNELKGVLIEDIKSDKLSLIEARQRCKELYATIPIHYSINERELESLMEEKYKNDPNWINTRRIFYIPISDIKLKWHDEIMNKIKSYFIPNIKNQRIK